MRITRNAGVVAGLVALMVAMSGCAPSSVTVDEAHPDAQLSVGQVLIVDLGMINASIGDDWVLTAEPDGAVLEQGPPGKSDVSGPPGSATQKKDTFATIGTGTATLVYEYRYRGDRPTAPADQKTRTFRVTVR